MGSLEQNGPSTQVFLQMWPSVRGGGLPSFSLPGLPQSSPGWKTEKRPLRKTKILWATGSPASESLCDPSATLDQLQGESFYWNVARPDLSSGKRQAGRQAAFCTLSLILGAGVGRGVGPWCRLAHTSIHRLSRAE